jgi:polysaccharide deacetylase family protein (PEP-CTERM system associated)
VSSGSQAILNSLTVDVEDYFQVSGFERDVRRTDWDSFESRVVVNTRSLLAMFAAHGVRATFFILGWVAEKFPELIREIDEAGHEIGSHGYWHRLIYDQSPTEFRNDLRRSQEAIERAIGRRAESYRAPSFSITNQSLWALPILVEEGFTSDSSIYPVYHDRYGIPQAEQSPHIIETSAGPILEFPPCFGAVGPLRLPISGGGYFRLLPYSVTSALLERVNRVSGRPFVFYIHPWEVDPQQPRLVAGSPLSRTRHYLNLKSTVAKLDQLLRRFRFGTISESLFHYSESTALTSFKAGDWTPHKTDAFPMAMREKVRNASLGCKL